MIQAALWLLGFGAGAVLEHIKSKTTCHLCPGTSYYETPCCKVRLCGHCGGKGINVVGHRRTFTCPACGKFKVCGT